MTTETGCTPTTSESLNDLRALLKVARDARSLHPKASGKLVRHEHGRLGAVLYEDPVGHFKQKGRPTYKVLDMETLHTFWWYQDRCTVVVEPSQIAA